MTGLPVLTAIIVWPALLALLVLATSLGGGEGRNRMARTVAIAGALVEIGLTALAIGPVLALHGGTAYALSENRVWVPYLGINYHVAVDGISLVLILLTSVVTFVSLFTMAPKDDRMPQHLALLLLAEATSMGIFLALDLVLFYLFWEAVLIPAYLLILGWGGPNRVRAAQRFLIMSLAGSLFMLVGIVAFASAATTAVGGFTFDLPTLVALHVNLVGLGGTLAFVAFALAFAIKSGLFPVHEWLPDAYTEAPMDTSIMLSSVLSKAGIYAFLRFLIPLFPKLTDRYGWILILLGVIGILYGAFIALRQTDMKRILAYSSLSHMGLMVAGVFALDVIGTQGAVLQMVSHGVVIAALFALVGMLEIRTGSREITAFGGIMSRAPVLAGLGMVAAMAGLGLPGLSSFAGEFLLLLGLFERNVALGVIASFGVILAAAYVLRLYQATVHGRLSGRAEGATRIDLQARDYVALVPMLAVSLLLGILPSLVTGRVTPALSHVSTPQAAKAVPTPQALGRAQVSQREGRA